MERRPAGQPDRPSRNDDVQCSLRRRINSNGASLLPHVGRHRDGIVQSRNPPPPAAYYVRSWVCCNSTPVVGLGGPAIPAGACGPGLTVAQSTANPAGGVCFIQAEVTWPIEDPKTNTNITGNPQGLFVDHNQVTSPSPSPLSFVNHVYGTLVREQ